MFLNTETFSGRSLRNKIYMRGLNLDWNFSLTSRCVISSNIYGDLVLKHSPECLAAFCSNAMHSGSKLENGTVYVAARSAPRVLEVPEAVIREGTMKVGCKPAGLSPLLSFVA